MTDGTNNNNNSPSVPSPSDALERQEGGGHYKHFKIQPIEFSEMNKLTPSEANVVKYVCRHRFKNGKEDLLKAKHYLDIMLELYYNDSNGKSTTDRLLNLNVTNGKEKEE